mmetsp:Transcript_14493/g.40820  ORF Transcript_14493/g.40820 Transcript_14493/m.40820 type:complete len:309 (+) Transcript_14493:226-1152(+)
MQGLLVEAVDPRRSVGVGPYEFGPPVMRDRRAPNLLQPVPLVDVGKPLLLLLRHRLLVHRVWFVPSAGECPVQNQVDVLSHVDVRHREDAVAVAVAGVGLDDLNEQYEPLEPLNQGAQVGRVEQLHRVPHPRQLLEGFIPQVLLRPKEVRLPKVYGVPCDGLPHEQVEPRHHDEVPQLGTPRVVCSLQCLHHGVQLGPPSRVIGDPGVVQEYRRVHLDHLRQLLAVVCHEPHIHLMALQPPGPNHVAEKVLVRPLKVASPMPVAAVIGDAPQDDEYPQLARHQLPLLWKSTGLCIVPATPQLAGCGDS